MSIIFQRAADSLSQISQSLLCTVYCHRVLTLSSFNWNGGRGDYPTYSGAQRFLMWLNTGRELRRIHRCVFSGNNWSSSRTQRRLITNSTANTCERKILCFLIIHRAETTAPSPRRGKWKKKKKKHVVGILGFSLGGIEPCIQPTAPYEVFFTRLDQKTRMPSNAGCYITHSLILHTLLSISPLICTHLSPGTSQPLSAKPSRHTNKTNEQWKEGCCTTTERKWMEMRVMCGGL